MSEPRDAEQSVLIDVQGARAGTAHAKPAVDVAFRRCDQNQPMLLPPDSGTGCRRITRPGG